MEREDELFIVGNILKSLEVSEEKVTVAIRIETSLRVLFHNALGHSQANQRVEEFKLQLKELKAKLKTAEKRAIIAEKMVKVFSKELDAREGKRCDYFLSLILPFCSVYWKLTNAAFPDFLFREKEKYKYICDDMDSTFSELTGY